MNAENENLEYKPMSDQDMFDELCMFEREIDEFFAFRHMQDIKRNVSQRAMIDMIVRTDKRRAYYHCFHNMKINECKIAAIYAYWILKFRPITIVDPRYSNDHDALCINECFAIYIIYATLAKVRGIVPTYAGANSYYNKLMYSFRFRNLSIDAMVLLVDSIGEDTMNMEYGNIE